MSLLCPRCKTVQPQENHHCVECGASLPPAPTEGPAFRFAEPVLLAPILLVKNAPSEEHAPTAPKPDDTPASNRKTRPTLVDANTDEQAANPPTPPCEPPDTLLPTAILTEGNRPETPPEQVQRPAAWKIPAFSALIGVIILGLAMAGAFWIVSQAKRAADARAMTLTAPHLPAPVSAASAPSMLPLTLLLQSAAAGRHVPVGSPVVITAFAVLDPGQSAALSLSYQPERGRKTMFSFAEGQLCSAHWTPSAPGRYQFTATALDGQHHTAVAHPLWITVDGPALSARASSRPVETAAVASEAVLPLPVLPIPVVKVSRSVSEWHAPRSVRVARHHKKPRVLAMLPPPSLSPPPSPVPPAPYHVVAASFPFPGSANILARALRARGLFAVTGHQRVKHGKTAYLVEVGAYRLPDEAQKKTLELQRRGYPAYVQRLR